MESYYLSRVLSLLIIVYSHYFRRFSALEPSFIICIAFIVVLVVEIAVILVAVTMAAHIVIAVVIVISIVCLGGHIYLPEGKAGCYH